MVQHTIEIGKDELIARAQYFPYWEIRDDSGRVLMKSTHETEGGNKTLSEWVEEFVKSKFMKLIFVRFGQGARDAVQRTYWLKTDEGKRMETETDEIIDPSMHMSTQAQNSGSPTYYINGFGGVNKQAPNNQGGFDMNKLMLVLEEKMAAERSYNAQILAEEKIRHLEEMANVRIEFSQKLADMRIKEAETKMREAKKLEQEIKAKEEDADAHPVREAVRGIVRGLADYGKNKLAPKEETPLSGASGAAAKPKTKTAFKVKSKAEAEEPKQLGAAAANAEDPFAEFDEGQKVKLLALMDMVKSDPELLKDFENIADTVEYEEEGSTETNHENQ